MNNGCLSNGWFRENETLWKGQAFSLQIKNIVFQTGSEYQDILVFDSETYGRVLALDGVIQVTERDEFGYQEMLAQVPLFACPNLGKRVLIIGGGDGGILREVCRHPPTSVKEVKMCEIDAEVVKTSKSYFKNSMATGFDDDRVTLMFRDGAAFLQEEFESGGRFDVIIVDCSDPVGPAESLYTKEFYTSMKKTLAPSGVLCMQGENLYLHLDLIANLLEICSGLFPKVSYYNGLVPTYPSGSIGFVICSNDSELRLNQVQINKLEVLQSIEKDLRYYSKEVHQAAFVLPVFANRALSKFLN